MEYLYSEMSTADKLEFEKLLSEDAGLRKEYNSLKTVRDELALVGDDNSTQAFNVPDQTGINWMGLRRPRTFLLRPIIAIAASLVILMLVGYFTDFALEITNDGFRIGFAESSTARISDEELKNLIALEIAKSNTAVNQLVSDDREKMNARFSEFEDRLLQRVDSTGRAVNKSQFAMLSGQIEERNIELLQQFFNKANIQQQEYFSAMLTQFNEYIQEQREEDLNLLQAGLMEIKYDQTKQKLETQEAIAALFSRVSNRQD